MTEADFDRISWHDCHIWGIELRSGDPAENDWTSDLVLWLDYIVEWVCPPGTPATFRVAPAELVFHGVTDPRIAIESDHTGSQVALHPWSIDGIRRLPIRDQRVYLDRPYYRWSIVLNWPNGGVIEVGAYGFSQRLLAEPVVTEEQMLMPSVRRRLLGGTGPGRGT
jgi:hypothetical protein